MWLPGRCPETGRPRARRSRHSMSRRRMMIKPEDRECRGRSVWTDAGKSGWLPAISGSPFPSAGRRVRGCEMAGRADGVDAQPGISLRPGGTVTLLTAIAGLTGATPRIPRALPPRLRERRNTLHALGYHRPRRPPRSARHRPPRCRRPTAGVPAAGAAVGLVASRVARAHAQTSTPLSPRRRQGRLGP